MIIYLDKPDEGEIAFKRFIFPDGQAHCEFDPATLAKAARSGEIALIGAIKSGNDVLNIALALDAVRSAFSQPYPAITLNISYLLGARMDRRIADGQPATLAVITQLLNACTAGLTAVRVLDPHSPITLASLTGSVALHPDALVAMALAHVEHEDGRAPVVGIPDAGAIARTHGILARLRAPHDIARCRKKRDSQTGKLSGFQLDEGDVAGRSVVIVDDICDGGGTFAGIAAVLRAQGATRVMLCVTHGIFSKGIEIVGIDEIFCTDSYGVPEAAGYEIATIDAEDPELLVYQKSGKLRLVIMTQFVAKLLHN